MRRKYLSVILSAIFVLVMFTVGCAEVEPSAQDQASDRIEKKASERKPPEPKNDVEYNNYVKAQQVYDSPDTIIWCSTTWGNASAPIVTIPIAGKLTSSSVSFYPNFQINYDNYGNTLVERRSVDGMYHGSPPPYRYGFTPGGQYVDFFNMPTVCTTALTQFTRQNTNVVVKIDQGIADAQKRAEAALKGGNEAEAQRILAEAVGG